MQEDRPDKAEAGTIATRKIDFVIQLLDDILNVDQPTTAAPLMPLELMSLKV